MKNYSIKNSLLRTTAAVLCFCLTLTFFSFVAYFSPKALTARADESPYAEFNNEVTLSNGQFTGSTSTAPLSPSGWTGAYIGDANNGGVVSGVIGLDLNFTKNFDKLELDRYAEFEKDTDVPKSPFGSKTPNPITGAYYPDTNKNVLMINNISKTAYGYSTSDITLSANSYYKFSAWVKTGLFGDKQGAAFAVTGLDKPVGIWNIDTVYDKLGDDGLPVLNVYNNYGFTEQIIYVATGPNTETVKLMLSVGYNAEFPYNYLSSGYAFFSNVTAYQMSPTNYHFATSDLKEKTDENLLIYDMNPTALLQYADENDNLIDIGSFSGGKTGWAKINDEEWVDDVYFNTYNGAGVFIEGKDAFGFTHAPLTPNGEYDPLTKDSDHRNNNIMVLSSFEGDEIYRTVSAGIRSNPVKIEKEQYYRLSLWYNTQKDASGSVIITGKDSSYLGKLGPFSNGSLTTDKNTARYGWQRNTFYIKGSAFDEAEINVELWLGGDDGASSGIIMFDDITLERITLKEYSDNMFGGTLVSIDSNISSGTGVANGDFKEMDFVERELDEPVTYPLAPTGWTFIDTVTAGTTGHSNSPIKTDDAIFGVAPTKEEHYEQHKSSYANIPNPKPASNEEDGGVNNALLMYSPKDTAFGYRSGSISVSAETEYKLSVNMLTELSGYGAALILKNGNSIIANIEGIHSPSFKDYSFYIAGAGGSATLTLEIWFGMTDKAENKSKLSSGYMFINTVSLETLFTDPNATATEVDIRMSVYNTADVSDLDFAAYRLGAYDFNAYDRYSTDPIKPLYDMTLTNGAGTVNYAGVIAGIPAGQNIIPSYFYNAHAAVENHFENSLYLENVTRGWSKYEADNTFGLTADSYYKIDFSVLVELEPGGEGNNLNKNAIGAGIWLNEQGITDIRNTYHQPALHDADGNPLYEYEFQTFSFYYAVGSANESVQWSLTLGGSEFPNQEIAGRMYLNRILVAGISPSEFADEAARIKEAEENEKEITDVLIVDNRVASESEEPPVDEPAEGEGTDKNGCDNMAWYVLPSVAFALAILAAIVMVAYKKFSAKHPKYNNKRKTATYDRKEMHLSDVEKDPEEIEVLRASDNIYENFDEDEAEPAVRKEKTRAASSDEAISPVVPTVAGDAIASDDEADDADQPAADQPAAKEKSVFDNEFDD